MRKATEELVGRFDRRLISRRELVAGLLVDLERYPELAIGSWRFSSGNLAEALSRRMRDW